MNIDEALTKVPSSVTTDAGRALYAEAYIGRVELKELGEKLNALRLDAGTHTRNGGLDPEVVANATIAFRKVEDASMRLGKMMQALDGGVSVYDRASTVGA